MQESQPPTAKKFDPRLRRFAYVLIILVLIAGGIAAFLLNEETEVEPEENETTEISPAESSLPADTETTIPEAAVEESPATVAARTMTFRQQQFDVFSFDVQKHELHLFHKDEDEKPYLSFDRVHQLLHADSQAVALLTNAGIFNPDFSPTGLLVTPTKAYRPLNTKEGNGNFYLQPNGVFYQLKDGSFGVRQTSDFHQPVDELRLATQSGPMLVIDGLIHPKFNEGSANLNIRSGVGVNEAGEVFFAISRREVNLYDFALLFREELGCSNALYLDGFISEMHLPQLDRDALVSPRQFSGIFAITLKE